MTPEPGPAAHPPTGPIQPLGGSEPPESDRAEPPDRRATDRWRMIRPLQHPDFRMLFAAVVLSVFGAGMWTVVMVYAVIAAGGGPVEVSIVATAGATGLLVCAIPGGIVADRVSRRRVLRAIELANFVAIASVVVVGAFAPVTVVQLAVVSFVLGAGLGFFYPSYSAMLPRILPPAQLLAANGLESAVRPALHQAAGPAAAGMLVAAILPHQAAIVIAVAHGAAFVLLLLLGPEPAAPDADSTRRPGVFHDLREAVVFTVHTPWLLWTLLFATGWVLVVLGPEEVLLPFLTRERIGEDPRWFGFLLAVYGIGGVAGSVVVSSMPIPKRYLTAMNVVWGVSTLPFVVIGLTDQYWLMLVSVFLVGFGFSYGNVIWGTLLQRRVPTHMLGRVSSLDFFVSLALMPVSMALAGPLSQAVSIQTIFIVAGVAPLLFGVVAIVAARMPRDEITHPLD